MQSLVIEVNKLLVVSLPPPLISIPVVKLALFHLPHRNIADQREIAAEV